MLLRAALIFTAAFPATVFAQAKAPDTLTRSGNWNVDYDEDACHLQAAFGAGREKVILSITRYELGDTFSLSLYGSRFTSSDPTRNAKVDFGLRGQPIEVSGLNGSVGDLSAIFFQSMRLDGWKPASPDEMAPEITPEQETSVTGLTVQAGYKKPLRLEFGPLAKPLAQLRSCQADLVKSWGYDPAVEAGLSKRVKQVNAPSAWLRSSDYPTEAVMKGYNGIVRVRLDVDPVGKVTGCRVINRSKPDVFADITCRAAIQRAKFQPAVDAAGQPVRSFTIVSTVWKMES